MREFSNFAGCLVFRLLSSCIFWGGYWDACVGLVAYRCLGFGTRHAVSQSGRPTGTSRPKPVVIRVEGEGGTGIFREYPCVFGQRALAPPYVVGQIRSLEPNLFCLEFGF